MFTYFIVNRTIDFDGLILDNSRILSYGNQRPGIWRYTMSTYSHYLGKDELQQGQQTTGYPTRTSMVPFTPTIYTASPPPAGRRRVLISILIALAILLLVGAIFSAVYLFAGNKPT